jgi:hypothetical protein
MDKWIEFRKKLKEKGIRLTAKNSIPNDNKLITFSYRIERGYDSGRYHWRTTRIHYDQINETLNLNNLSVYNIENSELYAVSLPKSEQHVKELQYMKDNNCITSSKPYGYRLRIEINHWDKNERIERIDQISHYFDGRGLLNNKDFLMPDRSFHNYGAAYTLWIKDDDALENLKMFLTFVPDISIKEIKRVINKVPIGETQ